MIKLLGDVHKRRLRSGEGVCPVRTFFGHGVRGILQIRTFALFSAKNFGFFEIYSVSAHTRGVIFRDFARTSFMDGPLGHPSFM